MDFDSSAAAHVTKAEGRADEKGLASQHRDDSHEHVSELRLDAEGIGSCKVCGGRCAHCAEPSVGLETKI